MSGREIKPNLRYGYQVHQDSTEEYAANLKKLLQIEDRKDAIRAAINDEIEIAFLGPHDPRNYGTKSYTPYSF